MADLDRLIADLQGELNLLQGASGIAAAAMGGAGAAVPVGNPSRSAQIARTAAPAASAAPTSSAEAAVTFRPRGRASSPAARTAVPLRAATAADDTIRVGIGVGAGARAGAKAGPSRGVPLPPLSNDPRLREMPRATMSPNNIARSAGHLSHGAALAASGATREEPFRDPNFVINNCENFRYFIVATHGDTPRNSNANSTMIVPDNTILIKTGGGYSCGSTIFSDAFHKIFHHYFRKEYLKYTFARFLGQDQADKYENDKALESLLYVTPGTDVTNKPVELSNEDMKTLDYIVGVSFVSHEDSELILLHSIETENIVDRIIKKTIKRESDIVAAINTVFPVDKTVKANVIIFMSCSDGPRYSADATKAIRLATSQSHYAKVGTSLNIPRPDKLPKFRDECPFYRPTRLTEYANKVSDVGYFFDLQLGPINESETAETHFSTAGAHKLSLITSIDVAISKAESAKIDPTQKCKIQGLLDIIERNREQYIRELKMAVQMAYIAKYKQAKQPGVEPRINLLQYVKELDDAEIAIKFGRARKIARMGWGEWLCELPKMAWGRVTGKSKNQDGGRRKTRHPKRNRNRNRKTHRGKR